MLAVLNQVLEHSKKLVFEKRIKDIDDEKFRHPSKSLREIQSFRTMQLQPNPDSAQKTFSGNKVTKILNPYVSTPF